MTSLQYHLYLELRQKANTELSSFVEIVARLNLESVSDLGKPRAMRGLPTV
jgi:hypothetical protein